MIEPANKSLLVSRQCFMHLRFVRHAMTVKAVMGKCYIESRSELGVCMLDCPYTITVLYINVTKIIFMIGIV